MTVGEEWGRFEKKIFRQAQGPILAISKNDFNRACGMFNVWLSFGQELGRLLVAYGARIPFTFVPGLIIIGSIYIFGAVKCLNKKIRCKRK
jgi:hypothetical protein